MGTDIITATDKYPESFFMYHLKESKHLEGMVLAGYKDLSNYHTVEGYDYYTTKPNRIEFLTSTPLMIPIHYNHESVRESFYDIFSDLEHNEYQELELFLEDYNSLTEDEKEMLDEQIMDIEVDVMNSWSEIMSDIEYVLEQNSVFHCTSDYIWGLDEKSLTLEVLYGDLKIKHSPLQEVW